MIENIRGKRSPRYLVHLVWEGNTLYSYDLACLPSVGDSVLFDVDEGSPLAGKFRVVDRELLFSEEECEATVHIMPVGDTKADTGMMD